MPYLFEEHFDDESLESYAFGTLAEARAEILEEHLLICEGCRTRLDTTEQYLKAMARGGLALRKSDAPGLLSRVSDWFRVPSMVWVPAAAVALGVILFVSWLSPRQGNANLAPVAETLLAYRGTPLVIPAHHPLILHLETKGMDLQAPVQMTLVDSSGRTLEQTTTKPGAFVDFQTTQPLNPGSYFVRILKPGSSEQAREFSLDVR